MEPTVQPRREACFLEDLIDTHGLVELGKSKATRPGDGIHSIIDLTMASAGTASRVVKWRYRTYFLSEI